MLEYWNFLHLFFFHFNTIFAVEWNNDIIRFPIMGYCFFCLTIYALLHQDYWSNWLQSQQSLMLYNKTYVTICLYCCWWWNPWCLLTAHLSHVSMIDQLHSYSVIKDLLVAPHNQAYTLNFNKNLQYSL